MHRDSRLLLVEVAGVRRVLDDGYVGSGQLARHHKFPVDRAVEGVLHNFVGILKSLRWFLDQQPHEQVSRLFRVERFKCNICFLDFLKHFRSVCAVERWASSEHLVDDAAEAPPVACLTVGPIFLEDFRGEVLGCATQAFRALRVGHILLGEAKVCEERKAVFVNQNILGLEANNN